MRKYMQRHEDSQCAFLRSPRPEEGNFFETSEIFSCSICGISFDQMDNLAVHQVAVHDDDDEREFLRAVAESESEFLYNGEPSAEDDDDDDHFSSLDLDAKSQSPLELSDDAE